KVELSNPEDFDSVSGKGVTAQINHKNTGLGNRALMEEMNSPISDDLQQKAKAEQEKGKTLSFLSIDGETIGFVVIADKIKKTSKKAIKNLQDHGIEVIMLTGDNPQTAKAVADELNLASFKAEMLPEDKLNEVEKLQKQGKKVAM